MIRIEVIDREGWHKEFVVEKTFTYLGSDSRSDIILSPGRGGGVLSPHAQLIVSLQTGECKLVNLANTDIMMGPAGGEALKPLSAVPLFEGSIFRLGEFTLVFRGGDTIAAVAPGRSGKNIGLTVALPGARLEPHRALEGSIRVSNLGDSRGAAQIELDLLGLDPTCYDIEPGPVLFPHAEKEVFFHIYHRGGKPLAGDCQVTFRATAPRAYPDEEVTVTRTIKVAPVYRHELSWDIPQKATQPGAPVFLPPQKPAERLQPERVESPVRAGVAIAEPPAAAKPISPTPVVEVPQPESQPPAETVEEYVSPPTVRRIRAPRPTKEQKLPETTPPGDEGEWVPPPTSPEAATNEVKAAVVEEPAVPQQAVEAGEKPAAAPPAVDEWNIPPAEQGDKPQVLRMKAKPAPGSSQPTPSTQASEDWWKPG